MSDTFFNADSYEYLQSLPLQDRYAEESDAFIDAVGFTPYEVLSHAHLFSTETVEEAQRLDALDIELFTITEA
jgi:hypothetical protein